MKKESFVICALAASSILMGSIMLNQMQALHNNESRIKSLEGELSAEVSGNAQMLKVISDENEHRVSMLEKDIGALLTEIDGLKYDIEALKSINGAMDGTVSFNPDDVTVLSGATTQQMQKALYGTELYGLSESFVIAEREYGENAYFLAAIAIHESKWGTSSRASNDNNLTGYAVYSDSSKGASFSSKSMSILRTAELLRENYLQEGGTYYNGKGVRDVNKKYCYGKDGNPDYHWSDSIISIANDLVNRTNR